MISLVGNTPLVRLNSVTAGIQATVLAKVEYFNPGGSVKDRIALRMIEAAEQSGALKPGGTIVEPTSGNTGVGLAIVAQQKGYHCIFVCPDKVSTDKINVLRAYGAEVVVCPTAVDPEHPDSYYNVSDRLVRETPGAWKPDQYSNPNNPLSHYHSTGPELLGADRGADPPTSWRASAPAAPSPAPGATSRTPATGRVQVVGADPGGGPSTPAAPGGRICVEGVGETSADRLRPHGRGRDRRRVRQGLFQMTRRLAKEEGLLVGGSCGMAVVAALRGRGAARPGRRGRRAPPATAGAATSPRSSTTSGWPTTASWRTRAPAHPSSELLQVEFVGEGTGALCLLRFVHG
ncbi:pyridoxal-phosphate dependent enzyme, partial [Streptomyces sp. L7]